MYSTSSVCAVNYQARALCAQRGSKERHRFIVGTCSLHDKNELSVLQYSEDSNHFDTSALYSHPDQVWAVETSPKDPSIVVTSRQSHSGSKAVTLWRMPKQSKEDIEDDLGANYTNIPVDLEEITSFNQSQKPAFVRCLKWHNTEDLLLGVDNKIMSVWEMESGKQSGVLVVDETASQMNSEGGSVAWNPHSAKECAVALGSTLQLVDTRDMDITTTKNNAHTGNIRDVDYNPNKPLTLITSGDDRKIRFWDVRNFSTPVKTLAGHSHWVWGARYNPHHDQLIISGGSDNLVNLWRIASCSSSPWLGSEDSSVNDPPDVKVRSMDQHEECVYNVAWSPADAWIYCSLSFDGRAIVNHVPSTEKYKILL